MAKRRKARGGSSGANRVARATEEPRSAPTASSRSASRSNRKSDSRRRSPLDRAQALVEKAFSARSFERQIELANQALDVSEDCADAYTLLSRFVADPRQARSLLEQALLAAERVLGPGQFRDAVGRFWKVPATRPYMRARVALAQCLWSLGCRPEAVEHLAKLLALNPADDQGVHYLLLAYALELERDEIVDRILKHYEERVAFVHFSNVLRAFRRGGDSPESRKLLEQARRINRFVVPRLLGGPQPDEVPPSYIPGDPNEALLYVQDFAGGWRQTPGAISWLRGICEGEAAGPARPPTGPTPAAKKKLAALPQRYGAIWQAVVTRVPAWLRDGERLVRPWLVLIVNYSSHQIIGHELVSAEPTSELLFDRLARAMLTPMSGAAHRPSEVQVREDPLWSAIRPHLEEIGVDCIFRTELEEADYVAVELQTSIESEGQPPAIVDAENFNSAQGAGYFAAAAEYFRRRPWQRVSPVAIIEVDCPQLSEFGPSRWYAGVMGQHGQTLGLALYDDPEAIETISGNCCQPGDSIPGTSLSVTFNEAFQFPIADLTAAEEHHWPVASPEAWPFVLCTDRGVEVRQVTSWELQLLESCLRAIPDFVEQHPFAEADPDDPPVPAAGGSLKLMLSWSGPGDHHHGCGAECEHCEE